MNERQITNTRTAREPNTTNRSVWQPQTTLNDTTTDPLSRLRARTQNEGKRGIATRTVVMLRYTAYMFTLILASVLTDTLLKMAGTTAYGGQLMWFSAFLMTIVAVAATVLYPTQRENTIEQYRHYVFGMSVLPGTAIAIIIWALRNVITSPAVADDTLASLLGFAVPAIFVCTVIIPPIVFVKMITGYHSLHKSSATDTEMVSSVTRQDHLHH